MPLWMEQYERSLAQPPLCEQLKVRDLCDNLLIQLNGSFVAGYRMSGICSYYASDDDRNRTKLLLEALIRSLSRAPWQRTTLYGAALPARRAASFGAAPLSAPIDTPAQRYERAGSFS